VPNKVIATVFILLLLVPVINSQSKVFRNLSLLRYSLTGNYVQENSVDPALAIIPSEYDRRTVLVLLDRLTRLDSHNDIAIQISIVNRIVRGGLYNFLLPSETEFLLTKISFMNQVLEQKLQYNDILAQADRMLFIAPEDARGFTWKATALYRMKRYEEANSLFERALSIAPNSSFVLERAASYYYYWSKGLSLRGLAMPLVERILSITLYSPRAFTISVDYYVEGGLCNNALEFARKWMWRYPMYGYAWVALGNAYWCMEDKYQAKIYYNYAISLSPSLANDLQSRITGK
jgi:tetratricopeptide (TPR) repeat protein